MINYQLFPRSVAIIPEIQVVKISPTKLFKNCGEHPRYSDICSKFDEIGQKIFDIEI